jgi:hypothetical protein
VSTSESAESLFGDVLKPFFDSIGHSHHFEPATRMSATASTADVMANIMFVGEVPIADIAFKQIAQASAQSSASGAAAKDTFQQITKIASGAGSALRRASIISGWGGARLAAAEAFHSLVGEQSKQSHGQWRHSTVA